MTKPNGNTVTAQLAQPEVDEAIRLWATEEVRKLTESARQKAESLEDATGLPADVIMLRLWAEMERASRAGMEWWAAENRFNGTTFQAIANALGWVGSPHVRKAFPGLDEHIAARARLQEDPERIEDLKLGGGRYIVHLEPREYYDLP